MECVCVCMLDFGLPHWQASQTALHAACGCGHEEAVEMLLSEPHIDRNPLDKVGVLVSAWAVCVLRNVGEQCGAVTWYCQ